MASGTNSNPINFVIKSSLGTGADLNNVKDVGFYQLYTGRNYLNTPNQFGLLVVVCAMNPNATSVEICQILMGSDGNLYYRMYYSDSTGWRSWYKFTMTAVS